MKHIVIPDLHGRYEMIDSIEELFLTVDGYIILLGDIFDSFDLSFVDQMKTFNRVKQLKEKYQDRFIWLLGNHDVHYLEIDNKKVRGDGFQADKAFVYQQALLSVTEYLSYVFIEGNYLFSHAGVTEKLLQYNEEITPDVRSLLDYNGVNDHLPWYHWCGPEKSGTEPFSGLIWVGYNQLVKYAAKGINQVVGHTYVESPEIVKSANNDTIYFVDCNKLCIFDTDNGDITVV